MGYFGNGCESDQYEEEYCKRCVHWKGCKVWLAHFEYNYEQKSGNNNIAKNILTMLIPIQEDDFCGKCSMFYEKQEMYNESHITFQN